jgi:hypothetical protein
MPTSRNRDYSSPPDTYHSMSATYAWNPYTVVTGANGLNTGAWSAAELSQDGALRVSLTSGISVDSLNISGLVVNTDQLEIINTSGVQYLASISGRLNNGLIGVTGTRTDVASGYATGYYIMGGGRAVDSATFRPGYVSGSGVMSNYDKDNGGLLVNQGNLDRAVDSVTVWNTGTTTVREGQSGILGGTGLFSGLLFSGNASRIEVFIQNISTVANSYIRFGNPASMQNFSFILNAASASGAGGGSFSNQSFRGAVYFSGGAVVGYEL